MHKVITQEELLLTTLRGKYASQFAKRFGDMEPHIIDMIIKGALVGINEDQFNQGMARLLAPGNKFMPDIAEFQSWCVSGSWWTAQEAWQRACDYSDQSDLDLAENKLKITALTKMAWDSVNYLVTQGNMREAFNQFKSIYETYLSKAQMQGRHQSWYVPPVMIATSKAVVVDVSKQKLGGDAEQIHNRTKELAGTGLAWPTAFKQAQMEVRGIVKQTFGAVA